MGPGWLGSGYCDDDHSALIKTDYDFHFDGCSKWFDGNWRQCCYTHDLAYWMGGSYWQRVKADAKLGW